MGLRNFHDMGKIKWPAGATSSHRLVLEQLAILADDEIQIADPGSGFLEKRTGLSGRQVSRILSLLRSWGFIERLAGGAQHTAVTYKLVFPGVTSTSTLNDSRVDTHVYPERSRVDTHVYPERSRVDTHVYPESKKPRRKKTSLRSSTVQATEATATAATAVRSSEELVPGLEIITYCPESEKQPVSTAPSENLNPDPQFPDLFPEMISKKEPLPEPPKSPTILTFPCNGEIKSWDLTEEKVAEYRESFPDLDVMGEIRKALQWVRDNRKKTAKGMPRFLGSWLGRANDRPRVSVTPRDQAAPSPAVDSPFLRGGVDWNDWSEKTLAAEHEAFCDRLKKK